MIGRFFEFLRSPGAGEEFRRETRQLVLSRMRIGALLAITFIPVFAPLDFLRLHDNFLAATAIRLSGCVLLGILVALTYLPSAERWAEWLAGFGIGAISAIILGVARFSDGAADPVYLVQAMAIIFVIMGAGLLLPVDGSSMLRLSLIPVAEQVVFTLDYDVFQNLPILSSSFIAAVIATVGARSTFRSRVGDYEGQRAKEELLQARSDLVSALSRDLSAREEAEEVLRRSEQKYRALFEDLKDGVILASPEGKIVDVNPAGLELFGFATKEELAATESEEFYCQVGDRDTIRRMIAQRGFLKDHEVELRRRDGQTVNVVLTMSIVRDASGALAGVRTILRDVTHERHMEAQLRQKQKLEAVGMLAAGVAHEINNPLTYVMSDLELLRGELERIGPASNGALAAMQERVAEALEGAERVRRIVRDLKTFSRVEEERRTSADLNRVLEKTLGMAAPEIRYRSRLVTDFGEIPLVLGNEGRLSQVFLNLVINAVQSFEHENDERNEIRISTCATEDEVLVEVADTGRGIPAEHLERLFDPFFTTKPVGEGSGLGLSICYNIIESYAGRIEVESRPGEGSRFVVRLPIATPGLAARVMEAPTLPAPPERARILIVDDEPLVLSTAKLILGREHEVLGARSGREALEVLRREPEVDVILCDLMMREISGMELYASLRQDAPALADRMVFMTGGAFTRTAQEFLGDVKNPCIEKPFNSSDLMEIIRQAIRGTESVP